MSSSKHQSQAEFATVADKILSVLRYRFRQGQTSTRSQ